MATLNLIAAMRSAVAPALTHLQHKIIYGVKTGIYSINVINATTSSYISNNTEKCSVFIFYRFAHF